MDKNKKYLVIIVGLLLILVGLLFVIFYKKDNNISDVSSNIIESNDSSIDSVNFSNSDEYNIVLSESVTITKAGVYYISGTLSDGSITINTNGDVKLVLNDVTITNSNGPAINVENANVVYIEINGTNTIKATTSEELDGAIYSCDDLVLSGSGTLNVTSNYDGIVSKDDLEITSGTYNITSDDDAIRGKDSVTISGGVFNIKSKGDGIKTTNEQEKGSIYISGGTFNIESYLDGISSISTITIKDGTYNIISGKNNSSSTDSKKSIKAVDNILISGGTFDITSNEDGIHSDASISISGGKFEVSAVDDGIHANVLVEIKEGNIIIDAAEGIEATYVKINGGIISISASDDGINAAQKSNDYTPTVEINDGTLTINMGQGDTDGIDSNGYIYINGGTITITGQSAFDYDIDAKYSGGKMIVNGEETTTITNQFGGQMNGGMMRGGNMQRDNMTPPSENGEEMTSPDQNAQKMIPSEDGSTTTRQKATKKQSSTNN